MKCLIILLMATLISVHQNARANVVSDSINSAIQNKNVITDVSNHSQEKYHDFDSVNRKFSFVLFYRSTCPHCQRFAPVLSQFAADYGFRVYSYSTDGQALPEFPNSMPMTTQVEQTFFSSPNIEVPSLFLINVKTMKAYLVDQGEMSYADLQNRMKLFISIFNSQLTSNE